MLFLLCAFFQLVQPETFSIFNGPCFCLFCFCFVLFFVFLFVLFLFVCLFVRACVRACVCVCVFMSVLASRIASAKQAGNKCSEMFALTNNSMDLSTVGVTPRRLTANRFISIQAMEVTTPAR